MFLNILLYCAHFVPNLLIRLQINFRPVLWGFGLQFLMAVLILRTGCGLSVFRFLGDKVRTFMSYADEGSEFVFGASYEEHLFAFKVLPIIVFFSAVISCLYYIGVMQYVITRLAWLLQITMKTAATESIIAAGNIFVGQVRACRRFTMWDCNTDSIPYKIMLQLTFERFCLFTVNARVYNIFCRVFVFRRKRRF